MKNQSQHKSILRELRGEMGATELAEIEYGLKEFFQGLLIGFIIGFVVAMQLL